MGAVTSTALRGMRWGIKASFVAYVASMPDGVMSATDGAVATGEGFVFPISDASGFDARTGAGTILFSGDVRFRCHGGMLSVRFADPRLSVDDDGAWLSVMNSSDRRRTIAHLGTPRQAPGGGIEIPAALAADSVAQFNDVYPEGTELDSVVIRGI